MKDLFKETFAYFVKGFEKEFSLPGNFYFSLLKEDDWSFIIKIHALIEAAVSQLLMNTFGDERLIYVFERLELSNRESGKIAFIKSMDLLDDRQQAFIRHLSELRNSIVHRISNVNFSFSEYISGLDANQVKSFKDKILHFIESDPDKKWGNLLIEKPKRVIWISGFYLISTIYYKIKQAQSKAEYISAMLDLSREYAESEDDVT